MSLRPSMNVQNKGARTPGQRTLAATLTAVSTLLVAGCAAGPDFERPAAPKSGHYGTSTLQAASVPYLDGYSATNTSPPLNFKLGEPVPAQWWRLLGNERINRLVQEALTHNPSLDAASAVLRQTEANVDAVRGYLLPSVGASVAAVEQKTSTGQRMTVYGASLSLGWGLDLFGSARRSLEARQAVVQTQRYALDAARTAIAANVVAALLREAALQEQLQSANTLLQLAVQKAQLSHEAVRLGAASQIEQLSADNAVLAARGALPSLQAQIASTRHVLAALLGRYPDEPGETTANHNSGNTSNALRLKDLSLPDVVPVSLPSDLARQRPDILAAEAQLHVASANVGVASANLFPSVGIGASFGTQALSLGDLFKTNFWTLAASITQNLFDGGTLSAQRRAALAAFDQAQANYKSSVLTALRDVAQALDTLQADALNHRDQATALDLAQRSLALTEKQASLGSVALPAVLTARANVAQAQSQYQQALAQRLADTAVLLATLAPSTEAASEAALATQGAATNVSKSSSKSSSQP